MSPPIHPLLNALRSCTVAEQHEFARLAGTKRNYLYQLAGATRCPKLKLALRIVDASVKMHTLTTGRVPKLTIQELIV